MPETLYGVHINFTAGCCEVVGFGSGAAPPHSSASMRSVSLLVLGLCALRAMTTDRAVAGEVLLAMTLVTTLSTHLHKSPTHLLPAVGGLASSGADVRLNSRRRARPLLRRDRPRFTNAQVRSQAAGLPASPKALLHARHFPVPVDTCLARPTFAPRRTGVWEAYPETDNFDFTCGEATDVCPSCATGSATADHLVDIYSSKCWVPIEEQCGSYQAEGDCYNREHSWPKSWWGGADKLSTPYTDLHHLFPTDGKVVSPVG